MMNSHDGQCCPSCCPAKSVLKNLPNRQPDKRFLVDVYERLWTCSDDRALQFLGAWVLIDSLYSDACASSLRS